MYEKLLLLYFTKDELEIWKDKNLQIQMAVFVLPFGVSVRPA